jgi:hypothetical protein
MTPHFEEYIAHHFLGRLLVGDHAQRETVEGEPMAGEQDVHGTFVALCNRPYQLGL